MCSLKAEACFHCQLAVAESDRQRYPIVYQQHVYPTCCAGCQAVATTIIDTGLSAYYQRRDTPGDTAVVIPAQHLAQLKLYDHKAMQQRFVHHHHDVCEAALIIEGIHCAACIWLNEQHLLRQPGVLSVEINYVSHRARIRWHKQATQLSQLLAAIHAIGYRAYPFDVQRQESIAQQARKQALARLGVAGLAMMQIMMYALPTYMHRSIEADMLRLLHWASFCLTLPVVGYSCWPFFRQVWHDVKLRRLSMDWPVSFAILSAFIGSFQATWRGQGAVYYDSVAMFVFFLLGGRYLEMRARHKASASAEALIKLLPALARRLVHYPQQREYEQVAVAQLAVGDKVLVQAGESYPADGQVIEGCSYADEALLTGESRPIQKQPKATVIGGTINLDSPVVIEVSHIGEASQLAGIVRLLDQALATKPHLAKLADKVAVHFVWLVFIAALMAWWYWSTRQPEQALPIMLAVLVVACPCALSLATPMALTVATGLLARHGILITRGHSLETLAKVSDMVFDKTGTLTEGTPRCCDILTFNTSLDNAKQLAAALEQCSEHPLAKALLAKSPPLQSAQTPQNYPGQGIQACIAGQNYRLGRIDFVAAHCREAIPSALKNWQPQASVVALADSQHWLAAFACTDALRLEASAALAALAPIRLHLLSGDQPTAVAHIAEQLGISRWHAAADPAAKMHYVQQLQANGCCVAMVGDGVNDAPVLAVANVSIAVAGGSELAQAHSDIVLLAPLSALPQAYALAKRTYRIIVQNMLWAIGYNVLAIPCAWLGWIAPWVASLGMALSALLVVLNALRLTRL